MPYTIKKVKDGYKVCKKSDKTTCFSKKGLPLKRAKKQMIAINISEHLKGGANEEDEEYEDEEYEEEEEQPEEEYEEDEEEEEEEEEKFTEMTLRKAYDSWDKKEYKTFDDYIEDNNIKLVEEEPNIEVDISNVSKMIRETGILSTFSIPDYNQNKKIRDTIKADLERYGYIITMPKVVQRRVDFYAQKPKVKGKKGIDGLGVVGTHRSNIIEKYKLEDKGYSLEELASITSTPLSTLQEVYNRGIGAYKTNPQSVRMKGSYKKNVKAPMSKKLSKEQWAMARVYSFLDGNPEHDEDLRMEGGLKPISARIGGKVLLKKKIVNEYFPNSNSYKTYVEPFVGGGSIYFYKNKDGHKEVINDLDPSIYQLFKGFQKYADNDLADDVNGDYTQEDFEKIKKSNPTSDYDKFLKTYLLYKLSYFGRGDSFGKPRINTKFPAYKERLDGVTILNEDYKKVIKDYDSKDTFFYLDPPTTEHVGKFNFQPTNIQELANICKSIKGKFLLSLANTKIKKDLFKEFTIKSIPTKYVGAKTKGGQSVKVNEYLIMNYNPRDLTGSGGMEEFHKQLEKNNITHDQYMKAAMKAAKENDYDPSKLEMASDGNHKLIYNTPEGKAVPFGKVDYNDYIIYTLTKNQYADKYRKAYRARATKIKGDWESDKYSPNNLAINILW